MRARRRASVHPVRARAPRFVCGGDDYLFILFDGSCKVCATTSPAAALAAAAAAICAPPLAMRCTCCSRVPSAHGADRLWNAALCARLSAAGVAGDNWQIQNSLAVCHCLSISRALSYLELSRVNSVRLRYMELHP